MLGLNDSMDVLDPTSIEDARKLALNNILSPPPPVNNTPHKEAKEGKFNIFKGAWLLNCQSVRLFIIDK